MRVELELLAHPKFVRLKKHIEKVEKGLEKDCLEMLLRIWGHCSVSQRGGTWRHVDPEYVEIIARWPGPSGAFYAAAVETGFIDERGKSIVIHDWDKMNSRTISNWEVGRLGGRPKANPKLTHGLPNDNPRVSSGLPNDNPRGTRPNDRTTERPDPVPSDNKRGTNTPPAGSERIRAADSRVQFQATEAQIKRLEKLKERIPEQDVRLGVLRRLRLKIQKKQSAGDYGIVEADEK